MTVQRGVRPATRRVAEVSSTAQRRTRSLPAGRRPPRPRLLLGHVHHRLHDPHRPVRRPLHVPASARARSSRPRIIGARAHARSPRSPAGGSRSHRGRPLVQPHGHAGHLGDGDLRLRRRRCCRSGCCSCPRDYLSSFLKIGTIAAARRSARSSPTPSSRRPAINHVFLARRARSCRGRSSPSSSSPSCAARSAASTPWSPAAPRPR